MQYFWSPLLRPIYFHHLPFLIKEWPKGSDSPLGGQCCAPFYGHLWRNHPTHSEGPWPCVGHHPKYPRSSSEGRSCSPWSRRITSEGNKHHPPDAAFDSYKHIHIFYSIGYSQLCKEGILISSPFARWVNWDPERFNSSVQDRSCIDFNGLPGCVGEGVQLGNDNNG